VTQPHVISQEFGQDGWQELPAPAPRARRGGTCWFILTFFFPRQITLQHGLPNTTRYRVAAKALVWQGPRLFSYSLEAAACTQAGARPRPPAGRGSWWCVFHARLEDIPGSALPRLLDCTSLCPRQSGAGNAPWKDAEIGYQVWAIPVRICCSSTLYPAPRVTASEACPGSSAL